MSDQPLRLLHIEDNPGDAILLREMLATLSPPSELEHVQTAAEGVAAVLTGNYDAVLVDLSLPDANRIEVVERLLAAAPKMPIVVLTGQLDNELALSAMHVGAQDYLVKSAFDAPMLRRTLLYAIERCRLAVELDRLRRRELDIKDQMLSHVSHELRTPLAAIYQFTTILLDGLAGTMSDEQREYLTIVLRNAGQLRRMIEDLLEVSRVDSGQLVVEARRVLLEPLLRGTLAQYEASAAAHSVILSLGACPDVEVLADPECVRQVLSNLIDNALKFTPSGRNIEVGIALESNAPEYARVSVRDTGCGIPEEDLLRVFDRLYQTNSVPVDSSRRGLGLGLYICRDLVLRQGGKIWVESRRGEGATFYFTVPVFSMAQFVQPLVKQQADVVHLLKVALTKRGSGTVVPPTESVSEAAFDVLRAAVHVGRDVLLPLPADDEPAGVFLVVTRAERAAALILAEQLAAEVRLKAELDSTTFDVQVSTLPLTVSGTTLEERAEATALAIQRAQASVGEVLACPTRF